MQFQETWPFQKAFKARFTLPGATKIGLKRTKTLMKQLSMLANTVRITKNMLSSTPLYVCRNIAKDLEGLLLSLNTNTNQQDQNQRDN